MALEDSIKTAVRREVAETRDTDNLTAAIHKMAEDQSSALVVIKDKELIGILTDMDITYSITSGDDPEKTQVSEVMTACELITGEGAKATPCVQLDEDESIKNALSIMNQAGVHYLLVSGADDKAIGLVSIRDLLKLAIS